MGPIQSVLRPHPQFSVLPLLPMPLRSTLRPSGLLLSLFSAAAQAQTTAAPGSGAGISGGSIVQAIFGLLIILGLLLLAAFFMRRLYGGRPFGQGPMKLLGGIAVGNRERILLVEVEDTWLVVGVAPGQIRTLHTLPKGELPAGQAAMGPPPFAHWLQQVMARRNEP